MRIEEIQRSCEQELALLTDGAAQCDYLMMLGMEMEPVFAVREDRYRIGGCRTAIWLRIREEEGRVTFEADSDSLLVKGILFLFGSMYQGRTREEIRGCPPRFIDQISELVIYPEIRHNGLGKCYRRLSGDISDAPDQKIE